MISAHLADEGMPASAVPQGFCAQMAEGLHAAAQPLTVLLASLSKEHTDAMQAGELRELAAGSMLEVQRVCTLFHYLQQLVVAECMQPELTLTPVLPLVQQVAEGTQQLFEHDQMQLRWVMPATCPSWMLDRTRTMQALWNVLLTAHAVSKRNDTIEVVMSCPAALSLRIVVCNRDASFASFACESRHVELGLSMAVAEANIRCQQGTFSWNLQPFRVDMTLQPIPIPGTGK